MALSTLGGQLLRYGNALALSLACCCRRFCRTTRQDECGNDVYECDNQEAGSVGPCTPECRPPEEPCECGPNRQCEECFECIDGKCVRIEDCCADGSPCPECQKCEDGSCVPCGECEQCVGGVCVPCGPCQKCEGGDCVPCGADEVCIGGVCVPKQYYCCWASATDKRLNTNNTTCKAATVSGSTQTSPCGTGTEEGETGEVDLTKSGPYANLQQCESNCQKYKCAPNACGDRECVPDPDGPYATRAECLAACPADPCSTPCTFSGANSAGIYAIDACERDICVSYVSPDSRPIRVQIWGPTLDNNCNIIASRVIKVDSDWRGEECCDCDSRPAGDLEGGPKGQIKWTKPRGVTSFEVAVLTACGATANIDIQCSDDCGDPPDPDMCPCSTDADCNEGCHCCDGECQEEPCCTETECRQYTYESPLDDEAGDFSAFAIGTCGKSNTAIEFIESEEIYRYTTLVTITCECRASFEAATGPLRGPDAETPGDPIPYEVVPCLCQCPPGCDSGCLVLPNGVNPEAFKEITCQDQTPVDVDHPCEPGTDCVGYFCCCNPLP